MECELIIWHAYIISNFASELAEEAETFLLREDTQSFSKQCNFCTIYYVVKLCYILVIFLNTKH